MQDWLWMTAAHLGRAIEVGEIDPEALCEAYLDAIEGHALSERIYVHVTAERARAEARASSARALARIDWVGSSPAIFTKPPSGTAAIW